MGRQEVSFESGGDRVAAWLYEPDSGAGGTCVVMAHGFSLTRHDGLALYADAFAAAGARVLVFDHRFLGDSGGEPRQRFSVSDQRQDWRNAVEFARRSDGVDPERIVVWGYSFSGGHAVHAAATDQRVAALIALCPFIDGFARVAGTPPALIAWVLPRAIVDRLGKHMLIPVTAPLGERGAMALEGECDGFAVAVPPDSPWRNEISPGAYATIVGYRPGWRARHVACPAWTAFGERDISVSRRAVERFASRAGDAELHYYDVDHFEPLHGDAAAAIAADQVDFLSRRGLLEPPNVAE